MQPDLKPYSRSRTALAVTALALSVLVAAGAGATNGYFTHGYGTPSKGLAGAGVALPQDTMIAATNPAGMAFVGKRFDAGLALFNPNRKYTVTGGPSGFPGTFGLVPGTVESDSDMFQVPFFGANWEVGGGNSTLGVILYGHGGMNTDYPASTFFASSPTGVDLSQLFITPTWATRFGSSDQHAFGVSLAIVYQQFEIEGVGSFAPFSSDPTRLSNNSKDDSLGYGLKLGYLGRWTDRFSFGLAYQSEMEMDDFADYSGLFAEQGSFNIPSSAWIGIAVEASDTITWVLDVQEIYYSDVPAVSNPLLPNLLRSPLGTNNGAGFGWQDMTVIKTGVQWETAGPWTWRVGFSTGDQPIPETEVLFNILAPGVMEEHLTFGFTRELAGGSRSLSFALMRAFSSSVKGNNPLEVPGMQQIELEMDQWDLEVGFSWGF